MIKEFMDDVMDGGVRAFFITFGIGIFLLILILFLTSCRTVELVSDLPAWWESVEFYPVPIEDVCGACGVDHQLLVAAGKDLNERYQTVKEW